MRPSRLGFYHPALDDYLEDTPQAIPGAVTSLSNTEEPLPPRAGMDRALDMVGFAGQVIRDVGIGIGAIILAWRLRQ